MNKERLNPLNDFAFLKAMGEKGGRNTAYRLFECRDQADRKSPYRACGNP
jgi:hypothetical protein